MRIKDWVHWVVPCTILLIHSFYVYDIGGVHITGIVVGFILTGSVVTYIDNCIELKTLFKIQEGARLMTIPILVCWFLSSICLTYIVIRGSSFAVGFLISSSWVTFFTFSLLTVWEPRQTNLSWLP